MLTVVRARNPLETVSWLRMIHLPLRCSSEFIKSFRIPRPEPRVKLSARESGESPEPLAGKGSRPVTIPFKCVGQKNAGAHQGHHRCNCLNHRTNPLRPRTTTERLQRCTVKKIRGLKSKIGGE